MTRTIAIARRELASYFYSPIAYVALVLFLVVSGILFSDDFQPGRPVEMRTIFDWMVWLLVFIMPVLSMNLLSQEWASGTIESLMTAPISETEVVAGKFFGLLSFYFVLLLPTFLYVVMLRIYGKPDYGPIFSGYLGIILVGAMFISVGLFCSSLTRSQVVAAVSAVALLFAITIVPWWATTKASLSTFWRNVCEQCVFNRYIDFSKGLIPTANVAFFLLATIVFLFLTVKILESRRWK